MVKAQYMYKLLAESIIPRYFSKPEKEEICRGFECHCSAFVCIHSITLTMCRRASGISAGGPVSHCSFFSHRLTLIFSGFVLSNYFLELRVIYICAFISILHLLVCFFWSPVKNCSSANCLKCVLVHSDTGQCIACKP